MNTINNIKKQLVDVRFVDDEKMSNVVVSNNAIDIITFDREIKPPPFTKRKGNIYVNNDTGEIIERRMNDSGVRSIESLSKTFKRMREVIRHNFVGDRSEVFLTLTIKRKIDDTKELSKIFNRFWDRFTKLNKDVKYRALVVIEVTDVGKYHYHCLIKRLDEKRLYLNRNMLRSLWNHGKVYVERLYCSKGLGVYLSSLYIKKKKDNLKYMPKELQIYRRYGKFEKIEKYNMKHGQAVNMAKDRNFVLDEIKSFELIDEDTNKIINQFTEESWLRKKNGFMFTLYFRDVEIAA